MRELIDKQEAIKILQDLAHEWRGTWTGDGVKLSLEELEKIKPMDDITKWLDPDIDSELALERIREIVYGTKPIKREGKGVIQVSLTAWFSIEGLERMLSANGVVGHLTADQYEQAKNWIHKMGEWTDANRGEDKDG